MLCDRAWTRYGGWLVDMLSQTIVLEGTFDRTRHRLARRPARDSKRTALRRRAHPG
jgi:hypothetical protein